MSSGLYQLIGQHIVVYTSLIHFTVCWYSVLYTVAIHCTERFVNMTGTHCGTAGGSSGVGSDYCGSLCW